MASPDVTASPASRYYALTVRGLEDEFASEVRGRLADAVVRGHKPALVAFSTSSPPEAVAGLRGAERLCATVADDCEVPNDLDGAKAVIAGCVSAAGDAAWARAVALLRAWRRMQGRPLPEADTGKEGPSFRATVHRCRQGSQQWKSPDVSGTLGAAVLRKAHWPVSLKEFDVNVFADVVPRADLAEAARARTAAAVAEAEAEVAAEREARGWSDADALQEVKRRTRPAARAEREAAEAAPSTMLVGFALYDDVRQRNRDTSTGHEPVTALQPFLAYLLARAAAPRPGETVLDPMCGVGTLLIEAALDWPEAHTSNAVRLNVLIACSGVSTIGS